jgi:hypothetical protein
MFKWMVGALILVIGTTSWVIYSKLGSGPVGSGHEVNWRELGELDYITGSMPPALKALDGAKVKVPGFMVPLEDQARKIKEFLLVPSPQACIHVPPPPPNQMVFVRMKEDGLVEPAHGPIWLYGTLQITTKKSIYGEASFEIVGDFIENYK